MVSGLVSIVGNWLRTAAQVVRLMLHPRVPWKFKLLIPGVLLYLLLPVDLVPDIIPLLGFADDLLVLTVSLTLFLSLAPKYASGTISQDRGSTHTEDTPHHQVVEGTYQLVDDDKETTGKG